MGFEKRVEHPEAKTTVRMKFTGHFKGVQKIVELPIPLIATSQKLDEVLTFTRDSNRKGPAFCDVPLEWAGLLLDVGGHWKLVEDLSPEVLVKVKEKKAVTEAKIKKFAEDNEMEEV